MAGSNVCILGDSPILGRPFSALAINAGASVRLCRRSESNFKRFSLDADILLVDLGRSRSVGKDAVKSGVCSHRCRK